uniref:Uncharacterized protein J1L n=1 Tax=Human cytomegalovirus (strain AD169) TaxID=10360 RepID=J1L_HCMVA|nr:RecName: Full=Uncharacterized protein J1L [Human herpesvirus 5 strain AD169]
IGEVGSLVRAANCPRPQRNLPYAARTAPAPAQPPSPAPTPSRTPPVSATPRHRRRPERSKTPDKRSAETTQARTVERTGSAPKHRPEARCRQQIPWDDTHRQCAGSVGHNTLTALNTPSRTHHAAPHRRCFGCVGARPGGCVPGVSRACVGCVGGVLAGCVRVCRGRVPGVSCRVCRGRVAGVPAGCGGGVCRRCARPRGVRLRRNECVASRPLFPPRSPGPSSLAPGRCFSCVPRDPCCRPPGTSSFPRGITQTQTRVFFSPCAPHVAFIRRRRPPHHTQLVAVHTRNSKFHPPAKNTPPPLEDPPRG